MSAAKDLLFPRGAGIRRVASVLVLSLAAASVSSCKNGVQPTQASIAGTWALKTVNGSALPAVTKVGDPKVEIITGTITITQGGTIGIQTVERHTVGGVVEQPYYFSDSYGYLLIESDITILFGDGSSLIGEIDGTQLRIRIGGFEEVYEQQAKSP